jgi:hypothetical protein
VDCVGRRGHPALGGFYFGTKERNFMAKLFPISLKVETAALGDVLLRLKSMPGVVDINLQLDDERAAVDPGVPGISKPRRSGKTVAGLGIQEAVLRLLSHGAPTSVKDIATGIGDSDTKRVSGSVHHLKKRYWIESAGVGIYKITSAGRRQVPIEATALEHLPKPRAEAAKLLEHKPAKTNGHANGHGNGSKQAKPLRGDGIKLLLKALVDGPKGVAELGKVLEEGGLSAKSFNGRSHAMRVGGLLKSDGKGTYELTTKGTKEAATLQTGA